MHLVQLLTDLEKLGGIQYSCIATPGEMLASTFPDILEGNMGGASRVALQILNAIHSIGSDHKEIIFELEDTLLMGHVVNDETVLVMLTEKEVNMALINTSVRSVLPAIMTALQPAAETVVNNSASAPEKAAPVKHNPALEAQLRSLMSQLSDLLAEYIGPAAAIVFDDSYDTWRKTHGVRLGKIAELLKLLAREVDDKADRTDFLQKAVTQVKAFSASRT